MREAKGRVLRFLTIKETAYCKDIMYKCPLFDSKSIASSFHFKKKQISHCILSRVGQGSKPPAGVIYFALL